ncbi:MAG TPA: HEAT repeat domain-containing protein, partial [Geobacteraceae bacterium]
MEYCHKIDKSLTERHTIVNLLESLKKEDITMEEMEKIGARLQKAGKRALYPLIRRLWREENGDHISRYVFLLDFFDDEVWIDQIVRIALKRNDLEEDGRAALLSVLEDYGIDISAPPFSKVLAELNGPLETTIPRLLDKGEAGMVRFMEDFLCYPRETQAAVVSRIARIKDPRVTSLLEVLLRFDDREIVGETIAALGRIRDVKAASLLQTFNSQGDAGLRDQAERS